jgi:DNA-binding response OmpR family regulator
MESNLPSSVLVTGSFINHTRCISDHLEDLVPSVKVLSVYDADEALSLLDKEPVNLFIIDVCLRGNLDGFDLCRTIRSSSVHRELPVILLLAGALSLERSKGILAGADLLLQRPVVKEELCKMVRLLLEWSLHRVDSRATTGARVQPLRHLRSVT